MGRTVVSIFAFLGLDVLSLRPHLPRACNHSPTFLCAARETRSFSHALQVQVRPAKAHSANGLGLSGPHYAGQRLPELEASTPALVTSLPRACF